VRIVPFVVAECPIVNAAGDGFEVVPVQLWRGAKGGPMLRVGNNTLWFNPDGTLEGGPEACLAAGVARPVVEAYTAALDRFAATVGARPATAYFGEGSPGWAAETALWPAEPVPDAPLRPGASYLHDGEEMTPLDAPESAWMLCVHAWPWIALAYGDGTALRCDRCGRERPCPSPRADEAGHAEAFYAFVTEHRGCRADTTPRGLA
jgi:hypothetical protein